MTAITQPSTAVSTWTIDPAHSSAEFSVKHMMVATARGRITSISGAIALNEANLAASSVEASADLSSIDTGNAQRDQHLRMDDFFNIEQFPTATFRSTRVEAQDAERAKVYGELTIRGITQEVAFDVELEGRGLDAYGKERLGVTVETSINRLDYGVKWNPAIETGGVVLGNRVRITLHLSAVRQDQ